MQNTEQRSEQFSVLSHGGIRHHNAKDKLGHPCCTFTFFCFQWYAMRVCHMVTFITHPLSGHLFTAGLQMLGSIPAFTDKGCRLLLTCRHSHAFTWLICSNQPKQKAYKHVITQTYAGGGQFLNIYTIISHTGVCVTRIQ